MPRLPETVRVQIGAVEEEWPVTGGKECDACGAQIFFAETGKLKADGRASMMPVDAEENEEGLHLPHWLNCTASDRFRGRRPGPGDRPR